MKPDLTLAEAKEMSLTKWRGIKAALPHVKLAPRGGQPDGRVYGKCGFCLYYYEENCGKDGHKCVLSPKYCSIAPRKYSLPLYWRICHKLQAGKDASKDIDKMIAVIEAVEV